MTKELTRQELLDGIKARFGEDIVEFFDKSPRRVYIEIKPESLLKVAAYIFRDLEARFNIASGVDVRSHLEILYHFSFEYLNVLISLRVKLDRENPHIDSLAPYIKGANWIEREINELLGVNFKGHPNLKRLLLSDEWPEGVYPLRQDYEEWDRNAIRDRGV
jgi:Ni,Fe-hydrogenase III component G